jgi:signal transduction histidine kinase
MSNRRAQVLRSAVFDTVLVLCVVPLAFIGRVNVVSPAGIAVIGCVMAAALIVRRRWPRAVLASVALLALAQVVFFRGFPDPQPFDIAVLVAMYSVVKYGRRMVDAYAAAGVVAAGIGIELIRHRSADWWLMALLYLGVCGGVWLTAYTVRQRRLYVSTLEDRASTLERERDHLARIAVADERAAIARELHDVVAHSLSVMIVQADGARYAFDTEPGRARAALDTVAATGREALEDMRRLVQVLRGSDLEQPARPDRRRAGLEQLTAFADRARSAGLTVDLAVDVAADELPPALSLTVIRLVQEALTNTLRHAGPGARVEVRVAATDGELTVSTVDDGAGRPGRDPGPESGHGLIGMRERVSVHGGQFSAGPGPTGGWRVSATIPRHRSEAVALVETAP